MADYDNCIEIFISGFGPNDAIIPYSENIGFALTQYNDFYPVNIQNDLYCLDFIYINQNQKSKGHGRRLLQLILEHFQRVIHSYDSSLGFLQHISKDHSLGKINIGLPFGNSFISSSLKNNRLPKVNGCLGGFGRKLSGY